MTLVQGGGVLAASIILLHASGTIRLAPRDRLPIPLPRLLPLM